MSIVFKICVTCPFLHFFVSSWINEILLRIRRIDTKKTGGGLDESLLQNPFGTAINLVRYHDWTKGLCGYSLNYSLLLNSVLPVFLTYIR